MFEKQPELLKKAVFWVVTPCSLVEVYQRFRGTCYLHLQALMMEAYKSGPITVSNSVYPD
jgi:hypothetical protein